MGFMPSALHGAACLGMDPIRANQARIHMASALGCQSICKDRALRPRALKSDPSVGARARPLLHWALAMGEGHHEAPMRAGWRRASVAAAQAKPGQSLWRGVKGPASAAPATLRRPSRSWPSYAILLQPPWMALGYQTVGPCNLKAIIFARLEFPGLTEWAEGKGLGITGPLLEPIRALLRSSSLSSPQRRAAIIACVDRDFWTQDTAW
eukprot:8432611-Pyramimonas_sp.AAC.1